MENVLIIGIAGGSGSGKTTLAKNIFNHFSDRISILRHDDYYKSQDSIPMEERIKTNYDHPHAFDTDLLIRDLKELTIEMSQLLKRHDEHLNRHEERIAAMEERPARDWASVKTAAISAITSGLVAAVMALILKYITN